jgi:flagellar protein FliO/FliZ
MRDREIPRDREMPRARAPLPERPRAMVPPPPPPPPPVDEPPNQDADQNLAEMAQRLEAALRRPKSTEPRVPEASRAPAMNGPAPEPMSMSDAISMSAADPGPQHDDAPAPHQQAPTRGAPAKPQKSVYDSLEQEMASLLGRPNSKT